MSLKPLQPGGMPLGQFDGYDAEVVLLKGGEVVTFGSVLVSGTDKAAADAFVDGYTNPSSAEQRVVVTNTLPSYATALMLADEGTADYGTSFGTLVGSFAGAQQTGGSVLGPHTTAGSGKVTCWDKPGLYAVSLDAVDTNAVTGLQPTNIVLKSGDKLYATSAGLLTPNSASSFAGAGLMPIGQFVSFETNSSLVNTPSYKVAALNSPGTSVAKAKTFKFAVIRFNP
jgi:hypothetical protein